MGYAWTIIAIFPYNLHETNREMAVVSNMSKYQTADTDILQKTPVPAMATRQGVCTDTVIHQSIRKTILISDIALSN